MQLLTHTAHRDNDPHKATQALAYFSSRAAAQYPYWAQTHCREPLILSVTGFFSVWLSLQVQRPSSILFSSSLHFSIQDQIQDQIKRQPLRVYSLTCVWLNVFLFLAFCEPTLKLLCFWPVNIQPVSTSLWPMCHDLYIFPLCLLFPDSCLDAGEKSQLFCFSMESGRKYKMVWCVLCTDNDPESREFLQYKTV